MLGFISAGGLTLWGHMPGEGQTPAETKPRIILTFGHCEVRRVFEERVK